MVCGVGVALLAGRLVQTLLVGVSPRDAGTLVVVALAMPGTAMAAAGLPAWRTARVDPAVTLRQG